MYRNKRRNEGIPYEAPNNRNEINDDVKQELAGTENIPNRYTRLKTCL